MGNAIYVWLDNFKYRTKKAALKRVQDILHDHPIGHVLEGQEFRILSDALDYHPNSEQKIGCGLQAIQIVLEDQCELSGWRMGQRRFDLIRTDGTREDFSYKKAINSVQNY